MATEPSDVERELRDRVKVWSQVGSEGMIHEKYGSVVDDLEAVAETWQLSE